MSRIPTQPGLQSPPRGRAPVVVATAVGVGVCVAAAVLRPGDFWPGYLVASVFWISGSLGCLGIGCLHRLTGGRWGWAISRELHAGLAALPVAALAVLPLIIGARSLYPWAMPGTITEALNPHQQSYLSASAVLGRTLAELLIWCALAAWLIWGYVRSAQDRQTHPTPRQSAFALIVVWLTITFASIDGLMSLTPGWASSMFGALHSMGCGLSGLALAIVARSLVIARRPLTPEEADLTQDLGSLLLAFNLLWVYFAFSEYLIMWSGDLPFEVDWFADRQQGWRRAAGTALILLHFAVPFALLLSRDLKRRPGPLAGIAGLLLVMQLCHFGWTVFPACAGTGPLTVVLLPASVVAIGGPWVLAFTAAARRLPIVDPLVMAAATEPETALEGTTR